VTDPVTVIEKISRQNSDRLNAEMEKAIDLRFAAGWRPGGTLAFQLEVVPEAALCHTGRGL